MLRGITPENKVQTNLFYSLKSPTEMASLMMAVDKINGRFGRGAIHFCAEGIKRDWKMKRERISPSYTTNWNHLLKVK